MSGQADLFDATLAAVVPQQPLAAVEDRIRFVHGIVIPLVLAGTNDGVGRMALPTGDAILGPSDADLSVALVSKADVKHEIRVALANDLAGRHAVLFPLIFRFWFEYGIALALVSPQLEIGDMLTIDIRGRDCEVEIVKLPFVPSHVR